MVPMLLIPFIPAQRQTYTFLSVRGKFLVNSTLKNFQYLDEDTDIPEQFLNATTYEEIGLIG